MFMRARVRLCLAVAVAFAPLAASAQTVTDERVWTTVALQGRPAAELPWRWASDLTARTRDGVDALDVLNLRVMVLYDMTSSASVGAGYVVANSYPASGGTITEHRAFQQLQWQGRRGASSVALRTRIEQRFTEANSGWALRLRQQVRFGHRLGASAVSLVGWDEIFVHANRTARYARGVEQNRAFGGLSFALTPSTRFEAGYLNQFSVGRGAPDRMNHVLSMTVSAAF